MCSERHTASVGPDKGPGIICCWRFEAVLLEEGKKIGNVMNDVIEDVSGVKIISKKKFHHVF